jgi:uncharacterized protein involved in type VI secretion and phage assembly
MTRRFNGFVSRFSVGKLDTRAHYTIDFGPKAWLLTRRRGSRVFEQQSVPQIVAGILRSVPGLAFDLRLTASYPARNYLVQRNETDFDFISRLLEDEGIFYYFADGPSGHVMVLADSPAGAMEIPLVHVYRTPALLPPPPGSVTAWEKTQEIRSGLVTLADHTFQLPDRNFASQAAIQPSVMAGAVEHHLAAGGAPALEQFDFPGGYAHHFDGVDPAGAEDPGELAKIQPEGDRLVAVRMQEEAAQALVINGESSAPDLAPGSLFTLGGLMAQFNGKYFVTASRTSSRPRAAAPEATATSSPASVGPALPAAAQDPEAGARRHRDRDGHRAGGGGDPDRQVRAREGEIPVAPGRPRPRRRIVVLLDPRRLALGRRGDRHRRRPGDHPSRRVGSARRVRRGRPGQADHRRQRLQRRPSAAAPTAALTSRGGPSAADLRTRVDKKNHVAL